MFSYRHGFHAGNHADVLKHLVLVQMLEHFSSKEKPFWVIDTHAGAGGYALDSGYAAQSAESASGIQRLWDQVAPRSDVPPVLVSYLAQVQAVNPDGVLHNYPGSPQIALQMLREQDRLRLFELHPTEIEVLKNHFARAGRRVMVAAEDGFAALKALLPPPPRRALVLIDPPYEVKTDYRTVITAVRDALQRFATGTYAIWYPQVQRPESRDLPEQLQRLAENTKMNWLHVSLTVKQPAEDGLGLNGSGMFIFNPPWKLEQNLRSALPFLVETLRQDSYARFTLSGFQA